MKKLFAFLVAAFSFLCSSAQKIDLRNATIKVNTKTYKTENYFSRHFKNEFGAPDDLLDDLSYYMYYERLGIDLVFRKGDEESIKYLFINFKPSGKTVKQFAGEFTIYGNKITRETKPEDIKKIKELELKRKPDEYAVLVQEYVFEAEDFTFTFTYNHNNLLEELKVYFYL